MKTIDFADNPPDLEILSINALKQMWTELRPETKMPTVRDLLIKGIGHALFDGAKMRAIFENASETEQLALRLLCDAGDSGLSLRLLQSEMARLTGMDCKKIIFGLFTRGMVLVSRNPNHRWRQHNKISFDEQGLGASMFRHHPLIASRACEIAVPGESNSLRFLRKSPDSSKLTFSVTPEDVIENLLAVCRTIDAQPLLMTIKGKLRAAAKKEMAKTTGLDEYEFLGWAKLARYLLVVDADGDGYWRRGLLAPRLINNPLTILSLLPATIQTYPAVVFNFSPNAAGLFQTFGYYDVDNASSLRSDLVSRFFVSLSAAAGSFPKSAQWFTDDDMASMLRLRVRKWAYKDAQAPYLYFQPSIAVSAAMDHARDFVTGVLNSLAQLGIVERRRRKEQRFARLTRVGAWAIRFGKAYIEDHSVIPGLEGAYSWNNNEIELTHSNDAAIVSMALGKLGERTSKRTFQVNGVTALRVAREGLPPAAIFEQLDSIVPGGMPDVVKQEITEELRQFQPVVIKPGLSVISVADMDNDELSKLSNLGLRVGDFILLDPDDESQFEVLANPIRAIDYDHPPIPSCVLTNELEIIFHDGKPHDLRLRQFLDDIGAGGELQPQLDPSRIPGFDSLSEKAATCRLETVFASLAPHLIDGFSDAAGVRLMAMAGLAEAPRLEECVVLIFPPEAAKGLMQLKIFGDEVELLSNGRLLVPRRALREVEEGLSELGIPFPAQHSTLLETGKTRLAVERLEEAFSAFKQPTEK